MNRIFFLTITSILFPLIISAQGNSILEGQIVDKKNHDPLPAANICIKSENGEKKVTVSDNNGFYQFKQLIKGNYILSVTYIGYKTVEKKIELKENKIHTENLVLAEDVTILQNVNVNGRATRATQKGDSLIYQASSFQVLQGSTAEDLLAKMPGIVVEGGSIQAQGENVQKVLVDGKEFFDGDVNLALKNLPSDVIASIEVFDKKSDQAEFTGFDDGEEIKTINIVTKPTFREGVFGELYGGYGTDNRYRTGGNINLFNKDQRISILGMSNNVNQQNFSQQDLAGVMSSTSSGRRKKKGNSRTETSSNFMTSNLGGVTSSNGIGINYVDQWNDNIDFTGSYFLNQSSNDKQQQLERNYFESVLPNLSYKEMTESSMNNWNHRINMKLDYQIDKNNSLIIRPTFSFQNNESVNYLSGGNYIDLTATDLVENHTNNDKTAYSIGSNITYRHRFPVEGRTISFMLNGNMSKTNGIAYSGYLNTSFEEVTSTNEYKQNKKTDNQQYNIRASMVYTEKLSDLFQLQINYRTSYSHTYSDYKTYGYSPVSDLYDQLYEDLSNEYTSNYLTQGAGLGLRFHKGTFNTIIETNLQSATLNGEEFFPLSDNLKHHYWSFLPSLTARYRIDKENSFMLRYRSSTASPSINDLQEVIDNTNPLFLSSGNPNLDQQINHSINLRYIRTSLSGQTFIAMLGTTLKSNYIADSSFIATESKPLSPSVTIEKGAQFTKPINLDGYYSLQSMLTYGFPADFIRSNINISLSVNYANMPTIFNDIRSNTKELNLIPKVIIGSNISKDLDFSISYSSSINQIYSSINNTQSSHYINHSALSKIGWTFWKGFTIRSNLQYTGYTGLENSDNNYFIWNLSLGKKFLKNKQAEIKVEAYDLLNQNKAFNHQVGSNYYDYVNSNVLQPYFMLSFVYTVR